jgi:phosphonate transport system substrate-binding protein
VIARGADLPNDILLAGSHVSEEMIEKFRTVFIENKQALAAAIVVEGEETQKYQGMTFLAGVKDSDYDYVRKMYATIGYPQFSEFIEE